MSITWFAARTNPRCEARAERSLTEAGFAVYAPREHEVRKHRRHHYDIDTIKPRWVGYVLVGQRPGHPHISHARSCDGVHSILKTGSGERSTYKAIPSELVERLRDEEFRGSFSGLMARRIANAAARRAEFKRGDLVEVVGGIFATKNGVIHKMMGRNRALLEVETLLGIPANVTIDVRDLRAA